MDYNEENDLAQSLGYTIYRNDETTGNPRIFRNSSVSIWYTGNKGWVCAELVSGHWSNHRFYKDLREALTTENVNRLNTN